MFRLSIAPAQQRLELALAAAFLLLPAASHAYYGTPTYIVHFDGASGGTIEVQNGPYLPEGACGLRVAEQDVMDWHWADYNPYGLGQPMADPPYGPPNSGTHPPGTSLDSLIEFTGPLGPGCGSEFAFLGPATGSAGTEASGAAAGAGALVFQVYDWSDVVWLNGNFSEWTPPSTPDFDEPEIVGVCDLFPNLCIEPTFTTENPCASNVFDCGDTGQGGAAAFAVSDALRAIVLTLQLASPAPADSKDQLLELIERARQSMDDSQFYGSSLQRSAKSEGMSPEATRDLTVLQAALGLARVKTQRCILSLKESEPRSRHTTKTETEPTAVEACSEAQRQWSRARSGFDSLVVWTAKREVLRK